MPAVTRSLISDDSSSAKHRTPHRQNETAAGDQNAAVTATHFSSLLAKDISAANARGVELGLTAEELAF
jgi:hypothetical protein